MRGPGAHLARQQQQALDTPRPGVGAAVGARRQAEEARRWLAPPRRPAATAAAQGRAPQPRVAAQNARASQQDHQEPPAQSAEQQAERERVQYARGHCYGCGVRLQIADPQVAGYVEPERYEVKARHRQLGQLLCCRCQELSHGAMIPAVADFAQQAQQAQQAPAPATAPPAGAPPPPPSSRQRTGFADKVLLTPEELRQKLKVVQARRAVAVLLVDLLDASGSLLGKVRELVGGNPIVLVGTKADLLPAGADPAAVAAWLQAAAAFKRINAVSAHLVSSRTGAGVGAAVAAIRRERRGRDVYVVGAANVGKSAFIRALVRDMASASSRQFDAMARSRGRYLPVESAMPGTTLELIPMEVFASGGTLFDTPGLHLHHRVPHLLTPAENKALHPRRRLRGYVPPSPRELLAATAAACSVPGGGGGGGAGAAAGEAASCAVATYWWGGLAKLQLLSCPPDTELAFYGPPALLVEASVEPADPPPGGGGASGGSWAGSGSSSGGEGAAEAEGGDSEEPHGFGAASVMRRGGLRPAKMLALRCGGGTGRRAIGDVAVSGVPGWIAVHASGGPGATVQIRVWAPPGVEVFSRPPLPVPSLVSEEPEAAAAAGGGGGGEGAAAAAPVPGGEPAAAPAAARRPDVVDDWW